MRALIVSIVFLCLSTALAFACPDYSLYGDTYELSGDQLYTERTFTVTAGGDNSIANCRNVRPGTDRGRGYVTTRPDFTFNLSRMSGYRLVIQIISSCDTVLLVNTASVNWYYDDDDGAGANGLITLTRPANGWLDVWVGTYDGSYCNARLSLETFNR